MSNNRFNMNNDEENKIIPLNFQIQINLEQKNKKKKISYYQQKNNYHNNYNNNYNNKRMNNNRFGNFNNYQHKQQKKIYNNNCHQKKKKKKRYEPKHPQYNDFENDFLNTHWTIHIHNTSETDWTLESYKKVFVIKKITDFWTFFNNFTDFQKFNFYIMRGDIKPVYEDLNNINGYSYSYIIPGRKVNKTFIHCLVEMMSEKLVDIQHHNEVCGVSLVPKPNGISIFKVWMRNKNNVLKLKIIDDNLINGRYQDYKLY